MSSSGESSLIRDASLLLWANLAGVTIGAAGFLAVLAVKWISSATWFKILQQFLIAAAISTLSGDALLHLIIHAMVVEDDGAHGGNKTADDHDHDHDHDDGNGTDHEHEHEHDDAPHHHHHEGGSHDSQVYRGIAALVGIFVFIMLGRISELIHTIRSRRSRKNLRAEIVEPSNAESANDETVTELSYSPASTNDQADSSQEEGQNASGEYIRSNMSVQALLAHSEQKLGMAAESKQLLPQSDVERSLVNKVDAYDESDSDAHEEHGHSHGHGHDHHFKGDLNGARTLIGTVLIGDAMHNFCDGLVIGVGFASGKLGGLSTSIAVFCHELPHELGDFAFLLHCGMRMRNALLCNVISAVVCMAGLWAGLLLDRTFQSLAPWVYMFTAGMFLHIALATMIPELTLKTDSRNVRNGSRRACSGNTGDVVLRFAAQIGGLLFGAAVMICIAVYEDKLAGMLQSG